MIRTLSRIAAGLLLLLAASPALAKGPVNETLLGVAIEGTDPVAYFKESRAVEGSRDFQTEWGGATWRFSSAENRDLFAADPERYAPQYGGYCAYAVSQGARAGIDPEAWKIVDDKLYLNLNKSIQKRWEGKQADYIVKADENWPGLRDG